MTSETISQERKIVTQILLNEAGFLSSMYSTSSSFGASGLDFLRSSYSGNGSKVGTTTSSGISLANPVISLNLYMMLTIMRARNTGLFPKYTLNLLYFAQIFNFL